MAKPKKKLGQHWMTSQRDLVSIADALSIEEGETVLEIGPGMGALTKVLFEKGARVVAVEKDTDCAEYLRHLFIEKQKSADLQVISENILKLDLKAGLNFKEPIKVAGNIPYYITSPILEWLISQRASVSEAVLTVQWEVAQRLAAKPGKKDWGSLSVFLQFYADVQLLRKIDKSHFHPAPKVDSGVILIRFLRSGRFPRVDESIFFLLVRRAFQKRRKTLLNALADKKGGFLAKENLQNAFQRLAIDAGRRPETLSIREWADLSESLGSPSQK